MRISTIGYETLSFTKSEDWLEWCLEQLAPFAEGLRELICEKSDLLSDDEVDDLRRQHRLPLWGRPDENYVRLAGTNEVRRIHDRLHNAEKEEAVNAALVEQHLSSVIYRLMELLRADSPCATPEELGWLVYYVFQAGRMSGIREKDKLATTLMRKRREGANTINEPYNELGPLYAPRVAALMEEQGLGKTKAMQEVAKEYGVSFDTVKRWLRRQRSGSPPRVQR